MFENAKSEITRKAGKDQRANIARMALINGLKKEYNFKEKEDNVPVSYDTVENTYVLKLKYLETDAILSDTLFTFLDKVFSEKDFSDYVIYKTKNKSTSAYQYKVFYKEFIDENILKVEEARLEEKYPEYKYLLKEYHDGMLLFEIIDQKIWSKAISDSIGLKNYYEEHNNEYKWGERWNGSIYKCSSEEISKKVSKIINKKSFGNKVTNKDLLKQFNLESEELIIETGLYSKGDNNIIDNLIWNITTENINTDYILYKGNMIKPEVKPLNETKGAVISDYQDYLDQEWIKKLRQQYNIKVNNKVLSTLN